MLKVTATNKKNQSIQITQSTSYQLVAITGIDPPVASMAMSELATDDGSEINNVKLPNRNIVLTIQPLGTIESTRTALYPYFMPKEYVKLAIKTGNRDVVIEGRVESFTVDYNANPQLIQISVICPKPYFKYKNSVETALTVGGSTTVNNLGDVAVGAVYEIDITGSVSSIVLGNSTTSDYMTLSDLELVSGDKVFITTTVGAKKIELLHNGGYSSLLSYLDLSNSKWLKLVAGNNLISVSVTSSRATAKVTYTPLYAGI